MGGIVPPILLISGKSRQVRHDICGKEVAWKFHNIVKFSLKFQCEMLHYGKVFCDIPLNVRINPSH